MPLQSDDQRYHVQCCIADPTAHRDPRCLFGATGRAEIRRLIPQQAVWFRPDVANVECPTCFAVPVTALHFNPADVADMPAFYQKLLKKGGRMKSKHPELIQAAALS